MDDPNNTVSPPQLLDLTLDPAKATANLAAMKAAWDGPPPPIEPQTAGDARRRLDLLIKDREWNSRYLDGHVAERKEWKALHDRIAAGDPAAGTVTAGGNFDFSSEDRPSQYVLNETVKMYRDAGISDGAISQALRGGGETPESIAAVKIFKAQRMSDPEWTKRFLSGGMQEKKEWLLWSIALASEPA